MRRSVVPALAAVVLLVCAAFGAWLWLIHGVAAELQKQAQVAGALADARVSTIEQVEAALIQPGLRVMVVDRATGATIVGGAPGARTEHVLSFGGAGLGPGGVPPGLPLPGGAPPFAGGPGGAFPLHPPEHPPHLEPQPLAQLALSLAGIPPIRIANGDLEIVIAPDARILGQWLLLDVATTLAALLAILGLMVWRGIVRARGERRALVARLLERREAADRYQRFLVETGHELRTPLTVVAGYVDILRAREAPSALDQRILDGLHEETVRMRALVEKMLALARLESDAAVPRLIDVAVAAREAAATIERRYAACEVLLEVEQSGSIVIDAGDYAAALGNLLENAVKYAPGSPILVRTAVERDRISTAVIDRGPGIAADERATIFERFARGRGRAFGEGLGLGLAIVERVAERWNGTVELVSGEAGSIFTLSFPLADEEVHATAR